MNRLIPPDDCGHKGGYMAEDGPRCAYCNLLLNKNQIAKLKGKFVSTHRPDSESCGFKDFFSEVRDLIQNFNPHGRQNSPENCSHGTYFRETTTINGKTEDSGWRCARCHAKVSQDE